ncbi:ATPase [Vitiosangium sp. GDMCC 1.1324]|uniref:ATPase n=1 Tax=Vitiosangium sp. (strain GDMCC 1.1324) TaxID=2138576 RepID=UPI000D3C526C|nr:ATPase [Vitiosangium sp. GDMCC 1.1324]PTL85621.1 ATPase [Vitiosangium sp. GDMCC 1.1324]
MAEQRRPGATPPGFESPDFETDTSRTVTPRETPAVPSGNVLSAPPRPRVPPGQGPAAPGGPARPPPAPGAPERRPVGPSPFLERRAPSPPSPEARRVISNLPTEQLPPVPADQRRTAPPAPPSMDLPSVIVDQRRTAPPVPTSELPPVPVEPRRQTSGAMPAASPERRSMTGTMRRAAVPEGGGASSSPGFWPNQPRTLAETGLTATMVEELVLKAIFFAGEMRGMDIANRLKLPSTIIDEILEGLRRQKYIDIRGGGGSGVGKSTMIYQLTTFATDVLRQILDRNRYNGPAPVSLQEWIDVVKKQTVRGNRITRQRMEDKFGDLIIRDYIFDGIGPAMNSGRAIFFYGPPGNGKTAICQGMVNCFDGEIFIPHAILIDDFIVRIYDSILHKPIEDDGSQPYDRRWVRCRRPLVVVGGELTLEMLDLVYSPEVKYYEAPFQMKATNGMLLIDDFGRQKVSPKDLLNRWIVPLESDVDMLTLHTGKKVQVPFDVFAAFSTNLEPSDLVDDAFLRRVRYKLEVQPPDEELFHQIFEVMCRKRGVPYDADMVQYLIDAHYKPVGRRFAACQPRDLLDQMIDMAYYRGMAPQLDQDLVDSAVRSYFVRFDKEKR